MQLASVIACANFVADKKNNIRLLFQRQAFVFRQFLHCNRKMILNTSEESLASCHAARIPEEFKDGNCCNNKIHGVYQDQCIRFSYNKKRNYVIYSVEVLELFFNKLNTAVRAWVVVYLEIATSEFCKSVSFLLHEELVHGLGKRPEYFLRQFPMLHFSRIRRAHDASESILRLFSKSFCTIWKLSEHKSLSLK